MSQETAANANQPLFIRKVIIDNFKSLQHASIDFTSGINILVGNNESGKTTVLEAICLAVSGAFRGEAINRCLSEYLFNREAVDRYIASVKAGSPEAPPSISIEVYLSGGDSRDLAIFEGSNNSLRERQASGYVLTIALDEAFRGEYESLVSRGAIDSLPIEYYSAKLMTFADDQISFRSIPIKSAMVNPSGEWRYQKADARAAKMLYDSLEDDLRVPLAQEYRTAIKRYQASESVKRVNERLADNPAYESQAVKLDVNIGTKDSWKNDLVVSVADIPYAHIGAGMQSAIQSEIALLKGKNAGVDLLLLEEPENHLSHSSLNMLIDMIASRISGRQAIVTTHSSFVANKLGLSSLILAGDKNSDWSVRLTDLSREDQEYFEKLPGYDTLRLVLCKQAILVEGPSDELVVQRAYRDLHEDRLPIEDGVDVISVGTSFKRFLHIAKAIGLKVSVVTDNDGHPETLDERFAEYGDLDNIQVCYDENAYTPQPGEDEWLRWNTLEATLLRANGKERLNRVFKKEYASDSELLRYMEANKTTCALSIFKSSESIDYPDYIDRAIRFVG